MTFSVNGIKQEKNEKYNVEMLVCVDSSLLARKILEKTNILILSLKEFPEDKKVFGDVYFIIKQGFQDIEIVTKYTQIQEAANFFRLIGFDYTHINRYSKPILQDEINTIITIAKIDTANKKEKVREDIQKKEDEDKKVYEDQDLESAKKIIVIVFEKVEECTKRATGLISISDSKKLKALVEDLKKLRMGTNFEKIRETIQEVFKILEIINNTYFDSIQNPNETISNESLVTPVDVQKELERMENIKILKSLHIHISIKNQDYATFGSSAMYRKFLQKDMLLKLSNLGGILYHIYDLVELILLIMIVLLGVYTLSNELYLFAVNQFGLAYMLISVGVWGTVVFMARYFRKRNIGKLLLVIVFAILLHYIFMWAVNTNFAL